MSVGEGSLDRTTQATGQHYRDGFYDQADRRGGREKRTERSWLEEVFVFDSNSENRHRSVEAVESLSEAREAG